MFRGDECGPPHSITDRRSRVARPSRTARSGGGHGRGFLVVDPDRGRNTDQVLKCRVVHRHPEHAGRVPLSGASVVFLDTLRVIHASFKAVERFIT